MGHRRGRAAATERLFDAFFADEYETVVAGLTLFVGDRDIARDAVDEALARAYERIGGGRSVDSLGAWVRVVALNIARSRFRRRAVERRHAREGYIDGSSEFAALPTTLLDVDVQRALLALPARQRQVLVCRYLLDMTVDQIASELSIAPGSVKNSLHHARIAAARALAHRRVSRMSDEVHRAAG